MENIPSFLAAAVRPDGVPEVDYPEEGGPGSSKSAHLAQSGIWPS